MAHHEHNAERDHGWWRDHYRGMSMRAIAARDKVDVATVSRGIARVRDEIPEAKREEVRKEVHDLYREIQAEAMRIADMLPPPVVAGKDGEPVLDPVTGEIFRDYSGRLAALKTAAEMADRARKLFGVDEATRVEVSTGEDEASRRLGAESAAYVHQGEG